jgi:beta-lactamase superfamily II metal-dependent hydrolase
MPAPESGVKVRMYRTGLGDCFLLAFRDRVGDPRYMLIDCGIHSQWKDGSNRIRSVVDHIRRSTNDHLDIVVVTHEHGDHVSGFYQARDAFKNMNVDAVWMAWTEDPDNELAKRLDRHRAFMLKALRAAHQGLADEDPAARNANHRLGFFELAETSLGISSRDARNAARDLVQNPRYLRPKTAPLTMPDVDGVRIFVLGPPEDEKWLMRARPSSKKEEVYEEDVRMRFGGDEAAACALMAAGGLALDTSDYARIEGNQPFTSNHRIPADIVMENAEDYGFFHEHYGFSDSDEAAWRRIDTDWQAAAETLALKLDAATNNTSLVLAIELKVSGRVLLFPGDAQVGNWKSWHEGIWTEENGLERGEQVSAEDLLNRTVLYKVGHHGSHNATLRGQGLEMMNSDDLTAIIPVDEKWAYDRRPYAWKMPFAPLYEDLLKRTHGRILRSDVGLVKPDRPGDAWREFKKRVRVEDLYVEVTVADD